MTMDFPATTMAAGHAPGDTGPRPGDHPPGALQRNARMTAAVGAVPPGVTVDAAGGTGARMAARDTVLLRAGETPPRWAPRAVDGAGQVEFSLTTIRAEKERVMVLLQHGYRSVFSQRGYAVLHRPGTVARAGLSQVAGR